MPKRKIFIEIQPLRVKLKSTIRHASASRTEGESVWVKAERNGIEGYGEGCPRPYVAGDDLESSVRWAQEMGLGVRGDFIVGTPAETMESLERTLEFAKRLKLDYAHFNKFVPFAGTELYEELVKQ